MSDLQAKIGDGLTKIQGSLQQGKQKLATAQEVAQLKKNSAEAAAKRLELIVALGEQTYELLRKEEITLAGLTGLAQAILDQDRLMYETNKTINEMNAKTETDLTCECGVHLNANAKFCGGCGQKVESRNKDQQDDYTLKCDTCKELNPGDSHYCGCCGNKI
ncbi:zinc ribbon domain-containing protein [Fictibacillus sp. b24]|uniref:zinc ribbon domain-containing protein n=1 Tax=Fictibacillus sp. b24 TaxID=3055863 RepID=UPI0025A18C38|nr:zinc ribbon domain-containing protein [Fictibacillus sp. b24]MDM5314844.1 zinc ribbon domain-containing protein [Fictibacillus sp. b24]